MTPTANAHARQRGMTGITIAKLTDEEMKALSPAEALQTVACNSPDAAAQMLREAWPDLWAEVVGTGRSHGLRPIPMMVKLIERGLLG